MQITKTPSTYQILLPRETVERINALLAQHPDLKLTYYGEHFGSDVWVLGGITPVPGSYVLTELKNKQVDLTEIESVVNKLIQENSDREIQRLNLIASARAKLTPEEIQACRL